MNDTDARRRNHWVSHIALLTRMAEAFPGVINVALFGQTEMSPVTCALSGEDALRNALSAHPSVAELAVIGAPHERWGETPVAIAVLAPGASLTLDNLRDWGTARLARYKLPTVLHIVDALPRNASGKVMKTALRQEYR